jgi:hypothetical protein
MISMENEMKIIKKNRQKRTIKNKEEEKDQEEFKINEHIYLNVKEGKKSKKTKHNNNQSLVIGNKGLRINLNFSAFKQLEIDNSLLKEKNNSFAIRIKHLEYILDKIAL